MFSRAEVITLSQDADMLHRSMHAVAYFPGEDEPRLDGARGFPAVKERRSLPHYKTIIKRKTNEHSYRGILHDFENPGNSTQ